MDTAWRVREGAHTKTRNTWRHEAHGGTGGTSCSDVPDRTAMVLGGAAGVEGGSGGEGGGYKYLLCVASRDTMDVFFVESSVQGSAA